MHFRGRRQVTTAGLAVFAVALAACSSSSSSTTTSTSTSTSTSSASASATSNSSLSGTLNGSGSTFQTVFQESAISAFKSVDPGITVNYGSGGSGKGRTDLASGVVNYAGSDSPIPASEVSSYNGKTVLYFPVIIGPITMSYNLSGVSNLKLTPKVIAEIFQAQITTWNNPAITALNPGVTLPSTPITLAVRSDSSGTTQNFTLFLKDSEPSLWKLGSSSTIKWPSTARAGNGNPGVAQIIKSTPGAIGYVDYADAKASGLSFASVQNSSGDYIAPSPSSASAAAAGVTVASNLTFAAAWASGASSYPITYQSWDLVYAMQPTANDAALLKAWIGYLISPSGGQALLGNLGYAPLPSGLDAKAQAQLSQITS
jgi:phosphate transport system substrate-binding protein